MRYIFTQILNDTGTDANDQVYSVNLSGHGIDRFFIGDQNALSGEYHLTDLFTGQGIFCLCAGRTEGILIRHQQNRCITIRDFT